MGILESAFGDLKRLKRKVKSRVVREVYGETKGERYNRRRLKKVQQEWRYYSGPLSHSEFMSKRLREGVTRNKQELKQQIGKWDKKALNAGKKITIEDVAERLFKLDIRRTPINEASFAATIEKNMPGGIREYGDFKFAGTFHRPDHFVNKDIVFEYKIIRSNTELHTAIGQALIYTYKYEHVVLIVFDARQGYDAVDPTDKELKFLADHKVVLVKYPLR